MLHGVVFHLAGLNTMQELSLALLYSGRVRVSEIVSQEFFQPRDVTDYESVDAALLRATQLFFLR